MKGYLKNSGIIFTVIMAVIIAIPLILLIPKSLTIKHKITLDEVVSIHETFQIDYFDLNGNGVSEMITSYMYNPDIASIIINNSKGIVDQWNFTGRFVEYQNRFIAGDSDQNGFFEIYTFILRVDSLWLYWFEPLNPGNSEITGLFLEKIASRNNSIDVWILSGGMHDMNMDGNPDLVFAVNTTFAAYPRRVFIFDRINNILKRTDDFGASIAGVKVFEPYNDGRKLILLNTFSHGNTRSRSIPYHDHSCWLMVFDSELKYCFEPVEIQGLFCQFTTIPFSHNAIPIIIGAHQIHGNVEIKPSFFVFDIHGNLINQKQIKGFERIEQVFLSVPDDVEALQVAIREKGIVYQMDHELEIKKQYSLGEPISKLTAEFDLDNNGRNEVVTLGIDNNRLKIFQQGFKNEVGLNLTETANILNGVTLRLRGEERPQLVVRTKDYNYHLTYTNNPFYYLGQSLYLISFVLAYALVWFIQNITQKRMQRQIKLEKQLSALQISNISNQFDPHFTFNILNTIGASILKNNAEESYRMLIRFSQLIRSGLTETGDISRSIQKEIDAVRNYLELQSEVHQGKFRYSIQLASDVNPEWLMPKMILQIHVENAIFHGLLPKSIPGHLSINFQKQHDYIHLVIEDNGVGRKAADERNSLKSTKKGLWLVKEIIENFNRLNTLKLSSTIEDLYDENGQASGTRVIIKIPVNYNYSMYAKS